MVDVFSAAGTRASSAAPTEEHAKEILLASTTAATLFQSLEAVFVVFGACFRIAQNLIGCKFKKNSKANNSTVW
jgi:hypothetical protein